MKDGFVGYHVIKADGSWMAYARDALSAPMEKYHTIVNDVIGNKFKIYGSTQWDEETDEDDNAGSSNEAGDQRSDDLEADRSRQEPGRSLPLTPLSDSSSGTAASDSDTDTKGLAARAPDVDG